MAQTKRKQTTKTTPTTKAAVIARSRYERVFESDGTYFLKLIVFVLLGTFWLKFKVPVEWLGVPLNALPIGLPIGLILVSLLEKHQSDRKIWYAILVVVTIICYNAPAGIVV